MSFFKKYGPLLPLREKSPSLQQNLKQPNTLEERFGLSTNYILMSE